MKAAILSVEVCCPTAFLRSAAENRSFADRLPGPMWVWLPSSAFQAPPPLPPRWLLLELACRLALEVRHQFGDVFRLLDHLLERRAPAFGERSGQQVRAVEAEDLRTGYLLRLRACEDVRVGARRDALVRREDPGGGQDRPRFRRAQVEEQLSHRFVVDEDGDHGAATDKRAVEARGDNRERRLVDRPPWLQPRVVAESDAADEAPLHVELGAGDLAEDEVYPVGEIGPEGAPDTACDVPVVEDRRHPSERCDHRGVVEAQLAGEQAAVLGGPGGADVDVLEPVGQRPRVRCWESPRRLAGGLHLLRDREQLCPSLRHRQTHRLEVVGPVPEDALRARLYGEPVGLPVDGPEVDPRLAVVLAEIVVADA